MAGTKPRRTSRVKVNVISSSACICILHWSLFSIEAFVNIEIWVLSRISHVQSCFSPIQRRQWQHRRDNALFITLSTRHATSAKKIIRFLLPDQVRVCIMDERIWALSKIHKSAAPSPSQMPPAQRRNSNVLTSRRGVPQSPQAVSTTITCAF